MNECREADIPMPRELPNRIDRQEWIPSAVGYQVHLFVTRSICTGLLHNAISSHPRKARGWIVERAFARDRYATMSGVLPAMNKPAKIALAVASLWPFVWVLIFVLFMFGTMFFVSFHGDHDQHQGMPLPFVLFFAAHIFTMFFVFALTAFYVVYLFRTDRVAFWYLYIWKEPEAVDNR